MRRECNRATGKSYRLNFWPVELWSRTGSKVAAKRTAWAGRAIRYSRASFRWLNICCRCKLCKYSTGGRSRRSGRHFENLSRFCQDAWNTSLEEQHKNIIVVTVTNRVYLPAQSPSQLLYIERINFHIFFKHFIYWKLPAKLTPPPCRKGFSFLKLPVFLKSPFVECWPLVSICSICSICWPSVSICERKQQGKGEGGELPHAFLDKAKLHFWKA